jgi:hypothetical protein
MIRQILKAAVTLYTLIMRKPVKFNGQQHQRYRQSPFIARHWPHPNWKALASR